MANPRNTKTSGYSLILALNDRLQMCMKAYEQFDDAADALPRDSLAADRLRQQSSNMFELTYVLREAILSVPAISLADAAVQLAALKRELALDSVMRDLSSHEERRRELVLTAGIDSIGGILQWGAPKYEKTQIDAGFPDYVASLHSTKADEYAAALRKTLPPGSFGEPAKPAEAA